MQTIDKVLNAGNLTQACYEVVRNKGAAGVDKMSVKELKGHLDNNREGLMERIRQGDYIPQPIRGKEISKGNGKMRLLGIPTVIDRMLQQAVSRVIMPQHEYMFSRYSYGFRPERNPLQAVTMALNYINSGYQHIVDIDLKGFFDEVDHCLLMGLLYRKIKCPITLQLIRRWLRVPIWSKGKLVKRRKGVPQGSPISPLLSNIILHELDTEMERRQLRFVRYADDFSIYCKTKQEARMIGNSIYIFLRDKLKLPINREKSGLRRPINFKILGYGFVPTYRKGEKGKYQLVVEEKRWKSFKAKLKELTRKTTPMSFDERIQKLKEVQRGWINNFRLASIHGKLNELDGWLRNRLRYCIWHHWKKSERKRKNLIKLGVEQGQAYAWSRSRMGGWAIAQSPILGTTITISRLVKRGYEALTTWYIKVAPKYKSYPLFPIV
ncbi:MAG: group II intron reverse transcriptase/maturase [Bacteroidales bacterium]|nr:group II intron reverse transcriptase/maturase [Bacteroidales bacterium]